MLLGGNDGNIPSNTQCVQHLVESNYLDIASSTRRFLFLGVRYGLLTEREQNIQFGICCVVGKEKTSRNMVMPHNKMILLVKDISMTINSVEGES